LRLLTVACLSLAIKLEEEHAPRLSEFPLDEDEFDSASILRMELLVLGTLEWRMIAVTPFPYMSYFAARFREDERRAILMRAVECVFAAIKGVDPFPLPPTHSDPFRSMEHELIFICSDKLGGVPAVDHRRGIHPRRARRGGDARRQPGRAQGDTGVIVPATRHRKPIPAGAAAHRGRPSSFLATALQLQSLWRKAQ
jgi:hypothetical protein